MDIKTVLALLAGTFAMFIIILILMKRYQIKTWKSLPIALLLTVVGTIGTYIWFFVESCRFGGRSYYGAVFFVPIVFILIARLFKIPYGELMDFCAPSECVMLAIMKYQCFVDGCCGGRVLYTYEEGRKIYFPSQIAELINAIIIMAILIKLGVGCEHKGKIYPIYLILYGVTRFILNFFRKDLDVFFAGLPAGNVWSILSVAIGIIWLIVLKRKNKGKTENV